MVAAAAKVLPILSSNRHTLAPVVYSRPSWQDVLSRELIPMAKALRNELFHPYGKTYAQTLAEQE